MWTVLAIGLSVAGFTLYYGSHDSNNWTLPVFVSIILAEGVIGSALAWRARARR